MNKLLSMGSLYECMSCHKLFEQANHTISNFCPTCAGKVFMGQYIKPTEEPNVKELLELSTLYHGLIIELAELWDVTLTPETRFSAFRSVSALGDEIKMKTLATVVLSKVQSNDQQ